MDPNGNITENSSGTQPGGKGWLGWNRLTKPKTRETKEGRSKNPIFGAFGLKGVATPRRQAESLEGFLHFLAIIEPGQVFDVFDT